MGLRFYAVDVIVNGMEKYLEICIVNSNLHEYLKKTLRFGSRVNFLYFNFMHCSLLSCSVCHIDTCKITHQLNHDFCSIIYHLNSSK